MPPALLDDRQAGLAPRLQSAAEVEDVGMLRAFGRWPPAKSACERTSSTTAPVSLISRVAPSVSSDDPEAPRITIGHTSIAPDTKAIAIRTMFSVTKSTGRRPVAQSGDYRIVAPFAIVDRQT
jgi:hypothetical protein